MRDVTSQERIVGNMMCDLQRCTTESMGRQNVFWVFKSFSHVATDSPSKHEWWVLSDIILPAA